ncbi:gp83.2 [Bacillus phage W.Ph.]|uniref:Gp83.2 n=1 Tax=Bacillus phage W.Ph. TaxID=764595 RepID=L7UUF4_9CAUD|nr:gp83.2 [Bacillus phage W.Ph.]AGC55702.1 gp83.2 [Bacillus phage W.Ph.]
MGYPCCDSCGKEIYSVIKRVYGGCCIECRERIEESKKNKSNKKGEKVNV